MSHIFRARKHVHHLKKYDTLKRKHAPKTPSTIKQSTLLKIVSQKSIDKAVVKYVVQGLQPFDVVEQEPFREFVQDLQPNSKILSRPTLCSRIDVASTEMKKKVTESIRGVDHIAATTTDCWSARRQSFLGVTDHWIDPDSLNRCCAALACKRLRGSHTFDVLAGALNDIHSEFEIRAETVEDACNLQLLRPNATRWISWFMAVERLLRIVKDKGEAAVRVLCTDFVVPMFNPAELAFLTEYAATMSPVAKAVNMATSNYQPPETRNLTESSCP
ncbi:hypothetical protein J4Q44_G00011940 [Coregonus suidteri]|uniref:Transposase n=1 Tax=Coregonus suidteri TaxID=861788 RepID=A0AAN8ML41_9TELE